MYPENEVYHTLNCSGESILTIFPRTKTPVYSVDEIDIVHKAQLLKAIKSRVQRAGINDDKIEIDVDTIAIVGKQKNDVVRFVSSDISLLRDISFSIEKLFPASTLWKKQNCGSNNAKSIFYGKILK